jgi:hypothetical protein
MKRVIYPQHLTAGQVAKYLVLAGLFSAEYYELIPDKSGIVTDHLLVQECDQHHQTESVKPFLPES